MNKELKEQAHKEFDELFPIVNIGRNIKFNEINGKKQIKSFIDSIIDKTVQSERERIVRELKIGLLNRMMRYDTKDGYSTLHDEILEKVSGDVDHILSFITNKSDSNKEERECNCGKGKIEGAQGCCGLCSSI